MLPLMHDVQALAPPLMEYEYVPEGQKVHADAPG